MRTAVVIPFYNASDLLEACMRSLFEGSMPPDMVFVVDNSTRPVDLDFCTNFSAVHIIRAQPGIGFGRACNLGARAALQADAEMVVFLNQDAVVHGNALKNLVAAMKQHSDVAVAAPVVYRYGGAWNSIEETYFRMYLAPLTDLLSDALIGKPLQQVYSIRHAVSGACLAVRASALATWGLFDPGIHMYGEDVDLFERYTGLGGRIVLAPDAKIAHKHGHVSAEGSDLLNIRRQIHRNTPYALMKKTGMAFTKRLARTLRFLAADYAGALGKGHWQWLFVYFATDLSLPFRLWRVYPRRKPAVLLKAMEKQCQYDLKKG